MFPGGEIGKISYSGEVVYSCLKETLMVIDRVKRSVGVERMGEKVLLWVRKAGNGDSQDLD